MTAQLRIRLIAGTGVPAIRLIGIGIGFRWSIWIIVLALLVCAGFGALAYLGLTRTPPQPIVRQPVPAPQPPVLAPIHQVNLASAIPDYDFLFDATVCWRPIGEPAPGDRHIRPGARAVEAIISRAAAVAAGADPDTAIRLQHRLDNVLGQVETDPSGRVVAWAEQVRIALSDAYAQRLQRLAEIRKDRTMWEHQRRFECDKREYLTDDVLSSTGSALVWWLSRNETEVARAADLIGTMARLSAAAQNDEIAGLFRHLVPADLLPPAAQQFAPAGSDGAEQPFGCVFGSGLGTPGGLLTELMNTLHLDEEQRSLFADQVAGNVEAAGNAAAADQIRRQFDVLPADPEPAVNGAATWLTPDAPDSGPGEG